MYNSQTHLLLLKNIIHTNDFIHLYHNICRVNKKCFTKLWDVVSPSETVEKNMYEHMFRMVYISELWPF
jgi:hypothetical protein